MVDPCSLYGGLPAAGFLHARGHAVTSRHVTSRFSEPGGGSREWGKDGVKKIHKRHQFKNRQTEKWHHQPFL